MSKDHIRYDLLVQDALKSVVRKVLADASRDGMPPDHHFYVSFRTNVAGTKISSRLREKYPEEMTIVLQHQYWDLNVGDNQFEVGLSFAGIPERLVVPFDTITGFYDPSVEFGLKFEVKDDAEAPVSIAPVPVASDDEVSAPRPFTPRSLRDRAASGAAARDDGELITRIGDGAKTARPQRVAREAEPDDAAPHPDASSQSDTPPEEPAADATDKKTDANGSVEKAPDAAGDVAAAEDADKVAAAHEEPVRETSGAQVVSLDAFRKKH